jgi:hypothetical protein
LGKCFYRFIKKHNPRHLRTNGINSPFSDDLAFWWELFKTMKVPPGSLGRSCNSTKILGRLLYVRHAHVNKLHPIKALCFPSIFIDAIKIADYLRRGMLSQELRDVKDLVNGVAEYITSKHKGKRGRETSHSPIPIHVLAPLMGWLGLTHNNIEGELNAGSIYSNPPADDKLLGYWLSGITSWEPPHNVEEHSDESNTSDEASVSEIEEASLSDISTEDPPSTNISQC